MAMTMTNKEPAYRHALVSAIIETRNKELAQLNFRVRQRQAVRRIMSTLYTHPCHNPGNTLVLFTSHVKSDRYLMHAPTTIVSGCVSLHLYP